jgi:transcriptional regulator with XRE-family HTH domain
MDQLKTGKFIAEMRKSKSLTQKQLADALLISDKTVSKWECGNGLPEVSLMLPLCEILGITVNELLTGKRLSSEEYQKNAEDNIVNLMKKMSETKFRMIVEVCVLFLTLVSSISLIMVASYASLTTAWRISLTAIGLVIIAIGIFICAILEMREAVFECKKCGAKFIPTKTA